MSSSEPVLGVVVVNYGSPSLLERHVLQHDLTQVPAVLVVVDNFSTARVRADVEELCRERGLTLVALPTNAGFGAGANVGAARALELGCSSLLFLNPDATIDARTASALHRQVVEHPRTMASPRVVHADRRPWFAGAEVSLVTGRTRRTGVLTGPELHPWLSGACLAVHADLWAALGGFDEAYFLYWEDVDLSVRCVRSGGELLVRDDLEVVHTVGGTQTGSGKSPVYVLYNCRNRLLFAVRHLSRRRTLRWVVSSPVYAAEVLRRGGWRRLLRTRGPLWAAARGTVAGIALVVRHPGASRTASSPGSRHRGARGVASG